MQMLQKIVTDVSSKVTSVMQMYRLLIKITEYFASFKQRTLLHEGKEMEQVMGRN